MIQFFDASFGDDATLGGKCAGLVAQTAAGLPVPAGFVVTTTAYEQFVAGSAPADDERLAGLDPADVAHVEAVSLGLRQQIRERPVPAGVAARIAAAYRELQSRFTVETPVAVRSSTTGGDLPDSYLWVTGPDGVTDAVRRCWASLYTSRAICHRLRNGIDGRRLALAVGVQRMVRARVSGVASTADDRSRVAIDASYGLGDTVVSGRVSPDHIVVDQAQRTIVTQRLGDKRIELVPDGGALVERAVDDARRARRCLTDDEIGAVAGLARRAERYYRCPQEVEWAIEGDDVFLLRCRSTVGGPVAAGRSA